MEYNSKREAKEDQKEHQDKCIDYGIRYIKSMIHHADSRFVVPIDAGIRLEDKVLKYVEQYELTDQFAGIILDFYDFDNQPSNYLTIFKK